MTLPPRLEFSPKTRLAAWHRAGGPDNPVCECGCCLPITKSDPAEYHHWHDRDDTSLENCGCVRRSCHKRLTGEDTMPRIKRSRRQERMEANVKPRKRPFPGSRNHRLKKKADGSVVDRETGETVWPRERAK